MHLWPQLQVESVRHTSKYITLPGLSSLGTVMEQGFLIILAVLQYDLSVCSWPYPWPAVWPEIPFRNCLRDKLQGSGKVGCTLVGQTIVMRSFGNWWQRCVVIVTGEGNNLPIWMLQSQTHLVIDCVEFCEQNTINGMRLATGGQVQQALIEFRQLIHCIIAYKSLSHKEHQFRFIQADEIAESPHERLIVLHTSCTIFQHFRTRMSNYSMQAVRHSAL